MEISLEDQKLLAWFYFRDEWERALTVVGERGRGRRRHLRKAAINKALMDALPEGASCKSCRHRRGEFCDLLSDFHGRVRATRLCVDYDQCKTNT